MMDTYIAILYFNGEYIFVEKTFDLVYYKVHEKIAELKKSYPNKRPHVKYYKAIMLHTRAE